VRCQTCDDEIVVASAVSGEASVESGRTGRSFAQVAPACGAGTGRRRACAGALKVLRRTRLTDLRDLVIQRAAALSPITSSENGLTRLIRDVRFATGSSIRVRDNVAVIAGQSGRGLKHDSTHEVLARIRDGRFAVRV
jgi:hypothetical protein